VIPPVEHFADAEPLEYFLLGRRIRQGLSRCTRAAAAKSDGDVFYLWLQTEVVEGSPALSGDQWLNIVDEAASLGVNWLVVTLGKLNEDRNHVADLCRWAQATHGMVVCLHARHGEINTAEKDLLRELPRESTFLLVDSDYTNSFSDLAEEGIHVGSASPTSGGDYREPCEYPHRMIFVNAGGKLYTCGLVSGEHEFFLGSVLEGTLDDIIHNPQLPHSVSATDPGAHVRCSGCPPLVAQYLCHK
jgi:radical SAM protein with 4Fe4S-binding SPASM domain